MSFVCTCVDMLQWRMNLTLKQTAGAALRFWGWRMSHVLVLHAGPCAAGRVCV